MRGKRESLELIRDILAAVRAKNGTIKPTHIMYRANLSHQMLNEYLADLLERGFLEEQEAAKGKNKGKTYALTDKGFDYLKEYGLITKFMQSFGLTDEEE